MRSKNAPRPDSSSAVWRQELSVELGGMKGVVELGTVRNRTAERLHPIRRSMR